MKLNNCCLKALKHGEKHCPICGQMLIPMGIPQQLKINFNQNQRG